MYVILALCHEPYQLFLIHDTCFLPDIIQKNLSLMSLTQ
jgi:hypothetical protein